MDHDRDPGASGDLRLLRGSVPGGAVRDLALTHALLRRVAAGAAPATLRHYRPDPTVAFGRLDAHRPGFAEAVVAARERGFEPALRAPGGRAAAYHRASLVVELVTPAADRAIRPRFDAMTALVLRALGDLGVEARIGELPGEYCPGAYSVIAGGAKMGGVAQKVIAGAALVSIALVVCDAASIRGVLVPVSEALGYAFEPATAGAIEDVRPGVGMDDVERALEQALSRDHRLLPADADDALLAAADALEPEHRAESAAAPRRPSQSMGRPVPARIRPDS